MSTKKERRQLLVDLALAKQEKEEDDRIRHQKMKSEMSHSCYPWALALGALAALLMFGAAWIDEHPGAGPISFLADTTFYMKLAAALSAFSCMVSTMIVCQCEF